VFSIGIIAFGLSLLVTFGVTWVLRRWSILDIPNERSFHTDPTPRGGGLGMAAGIMVASLLAPDLAGPTRVVILLAGSLFGAIGLFEDVVAVPALRRLILLVGAAASCLPWLLANLNGPVAWRALVATAVVFWLVGYANAFNFMDGINGLSGGHVLVAGLAWFAIGLVRDLPWLASIGLIVAAAALGFLPHNFPRARVFLGDTGSYFLGGVLGTVAVLGIRAGSPPEAILAPMAVHVADTLTTLFRRVIRREPWYEAHREHTYQRMTTALGGSHGSATLLVATAIAACSALGALSLLGDPAVRLAGDLGVLGVVALYLISPTLFERTRRRKLTVA